MILQPIPQQPCLPHPLREPTGFLLSPWNLLPDLSLAVHQVWTFLSFIKTIIKTWLHKIKKKKTDDGHFHHDSPHIKTLVFTYPLWGPFNNESIMKLDLGSIFPEISLIFRYTHQEKLTRQTKYYVYQNKRKELSFFKFQEFQASIKYWKHF